MYWVYLKTANSRAIPQKSFYTEYAAKQYIDKKLRIWHNFCRSYKITWSYLINYMGQDVGTFAI